MIRPSTLITHSPDKGYQRGDNWDARADCRDHDPEKWFPDKHNGHIADEAKAICRTCPVRTACLQDALDASDWGGIRGGLDGDELRREARRRAKKARKEKTA